jgi:hypothetical protein
MNKWLEQLIQQLSGGEQQQSPMGAGRIRGPVNTSKYLSGVDYSRQLGGGGLFSQGPSVGSSFSGGGGGSLGPLRTGPESDYLNAMHGSRPAINMMLKLGGGGGGGESPTHGVKGGDKLLSLVASLLGAQGQPGGRKQLTPPISMTPFGT